MRKNIHAAACSLVVLCFVTSAGCVKNDIASISNQVLKQTQEMTESSFNVQNSLSEPENSNNLNTEDSLPEDFNFLLNFNTYGKEQIDTYKGTFTKDLVMDGTKTIDFIIPADMKRELYELMLDIDIFSFPDTLKVDGMSVTPSCDYKLTVTANGKTKHIVWKEGFFLSMDDGLPKENKDFLKLVKKISDYIYETSEYKGMPAAKGGYN